MLPKTKKTAHGESSFLFLLAIDGYSEVPASAVKLLNSFSQFLTRLELCNLLCCDRDLSACCRVNALTSWLLCHRECTKANELNAVALYECVLDGSKSCVNSLLRSFLADS